MALPKIIPRAALLAVALLLAHAGAGAVERDRLFSLPVDCAGTDLCFVQNYFDQQPGPGWADYTCRHLSYDDHTGTDIRVSYADMMRGVPVLAVADGVVVALRDGMPDISVEDIGVEALEGRMAGNGVLIDHNGGLLSQYSHLRRGSVMVKKGDVVLRGQPIGLVGLSGKTVFPHVEFSVHMNGERLDPFTGGGSQGCDEPATPMWNEAALSDLAYQPRGGLGGGLSSEKPDLNRVLLGDSASLRFGTGRLYFWVAMFGVRQGDTMRLRLFGPGGRLLADSSLVIDRDLAQKLAFVGRRMRPGDWKPGRYSGDCTLIPAEGGPPVRVARSVFLPAND